MNKESASQGHLSKAWTEIKRGSHETLERATNSAAHIINAVFGLPVPVVYRETASNNVNETYTTFILPSPATRRQKIIASMFNVIEKPDMTDPAEESLEGIDWLNAQTGVKDAFIERNGHRLVVLGALPEGYERAISQEARVIAPFAGKLALIRDIPPRTL